MSDGINTPLTIACEEEQTNAVKRKMEIGKDVHMIYTSLFPQKTPCKDIYKYHQTTYMSMINYLIKSGANVNLNDGCKKTINNSM